MQKFLTTVLFTTAIALSAAAQAGVSLTVKPTIVKQSCYTREDAEAEQAIRIRSELMVIGLNCQMSRYRGTSENLYSVYRQFTADHGSEFAAYERQMENYYRRAGSKNASESVNQLGTAFGNKIALDVAKMRPDIFCYQYSPRMQKIKGMSAEQFRQWAATSYATHPATHPACKE